MKSRRILLILLGVILLLFLFSLIYINSRIHFEPQEEEPIVIDPSYAAGNGIYLPDWEPIHNDKIVNILFLGTDYQINQEERGRADSNMLCSLNLRTGEIRLVSFERGIGVPVPGRGSDILTHAYRWGGAALSQAIISQMFCVDVKGYVQVDFKSFAKLIDKLGGVDVELTELEAKALNGAVSANVWAWGEMHEGWNHLGGHDTLEYCRLRAIDSDWDRQRRQRSVLEQVRKRCREMSPFALIEFADSALDIVHTNLGRDDVMQLIRHLPKLMHGSVEQLQVPDKNGTEGYIRCIPEYEAKKIANFLYHANYEIDSPY